MQSQAVQVKNSIQKIVFEEDRAVRYLVTYNKVFKTSLEYFYTYTNQKSVIPLNKNKNIFGIQNKVEISFLQEESRDRGSCMFYKGQVFLSKFDKQKFLFFKKSGYDGDFSYLAVKCMHRNNDVLMKNKFNVSGFSGLEKLLLTGEAVEFVFCMLLCIVSVSIIGGIFFGIKKGRKMLKKIK